MTVTAFLEFTVTPESLDAAAAVIHDTLEQTRAFPGNLGLEVLVDAEDPAHFVVRELWESMESDDAYRAWRATDEGKSNLGSILAGAPTLTKFTTAETL
jgi:quinol monooxygenase YgiN